MELNVLYNCDCVEGMKNIPDASVDLVIADPPFGIDFKPNKENYNRTKQNVLDGYKDIKKENYFDFTMAWLTEATRLLKQSGSMYIFSGWNNLRDILNAIEELKLITVNHIIWKYQFGVVTSRKYVTSHYHCLYVCKDDKKRKFNTYARYTQQDVDFKGRKKHYLDKEDVWIINREYWRDNIKTPTKLPMELINKILDYSSDPGDIVLDPFVGSGQVPVACKTKNRYFIGFEIIKEYYEFALSRL